MDEVAHARGHLRALTVVLSLTVALFVSCHAHTPTAPTPPGTPGEPPPAGSAPPPAPGPPATLVGAGDIAHCGNELANAEATARLLDRIDGTIFTSGDNSQGSGSHAEYRDCFAPTWGRHLSRIRPSPGNHDYGTPGAAPYFAYFGANAGPSGLGYYSYDLGDWHVVSLNSNVAMGPGSPQASWLRQDLAASGRPCTVAYWHHPLMASGENGPTASVRDLWNVLYEHGVEIVMNGHDHMYERYAPQDPNGRVDQTRGIRQFVVGTGGMYLYDARQPQPNVEARVKAHGVMQLTLRHDGYDWQFIRADNGGVADSGSGTCRQ